MTRTVLGLARLYTAFEPLRKAFLSKAIQGEGDDLKVELGVLPTILMQCNLIQVYCCSECIS